MAVGMDRRKLWSIALGTCLLVLFAGLAALNAFNKGFLDPATTGQIFVYTGLSVVAFLLFVAVLVLLVRNVLKLYADQRSRVMGTRLRTRMLWGAVLVSLLPIVFMFAFSWGLMNRAVDRWFSQPVTEMRDDANRMALELARYTTANARAEADAIAASLPEFAEPGAEPAITKHKEGHSAIANTAHQNREVLRNALRQREITLQNGFAIVFHNKRVLAAFQMPQPNGATAQVKTWLPEQTTDDDGIAKSTDDGGSRNEFTDAAILAAAQRNDEPVFSLGQIDYALGTATLKGGGIVVVGLPMPYGMAATMIRLRASADSYWKLFRERRQIRNLYTAAVADDDEPRAVCVELAGAASFEASDQAGRSAG